MTGWLACAVGPSVALSVGTSPAEDGLPLLPDHLLDDLDAGLAPRLVGGQEHHAGGVVAGARQPEPELRALPV